MAKWVKTDTKGKPLLNQKYPSIKMLKLHLQVCNISRFKIHNSETPLSNNLSFLPLWNMIFTISKTPQSLCVLCAKSPQSCPTLCNPMDCSPSGSSLHGILQARKLEWLAIPFSRGSSQPRDQTQASYISCTGRSVLSH